MPDFILLLICVWEDLPVSIPGKKRNRTGRFRGEINPEEPTVTVNSLEEESGLPGPNNRKPPAFPCAAAVYVISSFSQSWIVQRDCFGSPRKFWAVCPPHFPLCRDFTVLHKDTTC